MNRGRSPGRPPARGTRTIGMCSFDARIRGSTRPPFEGSRGRLDGFLCWRNARLQKVLARADGTSRRASGWAGEKVARSGRSISPNPRRDNERAWRDHLDGLRSSNARTEGQSGDFLFISDTLQLQIEYPKKKNKELRRSCESANHFRL